MNTGDRIKQLRLASGMTQEELASKLGLQKSAVAKYENGRVSNIKRDTIQKLANIFDKSPSYIMCLENDTPSIVREESNYYIDEEARAYANELKNNKELRMLFDASRDASKEDLKTVYDMLLLLKKRERGDE